MTNHLSDRDLVLQDTDLPQLGPDTVLWRRFGDWRSTFAALYAGLLQITHEDVSTALVQHSNVFDNEVARLLRSAFPIIRTVYEGEEVGAMIRDYHRDIKGHRNDGSRYHSLDPAVYYWAHATFAAMPYALAGNFMPPMTDEEKERLFQESRAWYRLYGVSEPVGAPRTYAEYEEYFDRVVDEQLDRQETVDRSRIVRALTLDSPLPWLPEWVWRPIAPRHEGTALLGRRGAAARDPAPQARLVVDAFRRHPVHLVLPRRPRHLHRSAPPGPHGPHRRTCVQPPREPPLIRPARRRSLP